MYSESLENFPIGNTLKKTLLSLCLKTKSCYAYDKYAFSTHYYGCSLFFFFILNHKGYHFPRCRQIPLHPRIISTHGVVVIDTSAGEELRWLQSVIFFKKGLKIKKTKLSVRVEQISNDF